MLPICICDDSSVSIAQLKILLHQFQEDYHITFHLDYFQSGQDLLSQLSQEHRYSIYLLDILMPGQSGIEIARKIREKDADAGIIFLTASPEYALDAFSVAATDYLIKPVQYDALIRSLFRILTPVQSQVLKEKDYIISDNGEQKIPYQNICYIEIKGKRLLLTLNNKSKIELHQTLTSFIDEVKSTGFFLQIHKKYLINLKYIREISKFNVLLIPDYRLPVARDFMSILKESYFTYSENN